MNAHVASTTFIPYIPNNGPMTLTSEAAAYILANLRYEKQVRDHGLGAKNQIATLSDIMSRGKWEPGRQLAFARLGGRLFLMDGYHRMHAQVATGMTIEWSSLIRDFDTEADVASYYYSFDTNIRARTTRTILTALGSAQELGVSNTLAEALYAAIPLLSSGFDFALNATDVKERKVIDRRLASLMSYKTEIQLWDKHTAPAPQQIRTRLRRQGPLAVALTVFRHMPEVAAEFYEGISRNDGLRANDPRARYLHHMLIIQEKKIAASSEFLARQAAVAWNAWVEKRELKLIKVDPEHTFRINGTPIGFAIPAAS